MNRIRNNPIILIELIYLLIPLALVFSRAISDLFLIIIVIFFILYSIKNKIFHYYKSKLFIFYIIFCIFLISISLIKNNQIPISVLFFFRFGIFSLATWFLLDNNNELVKKIFLSIFFTCLIVVIDAFFQYLVGYNFLGYEHLDKSSRLSGFFKDELILGSYLTRLSPLFFLQMYIFFMIKKNIFYMSIIYSIIIFIYSFVIYLTGERTAFIYFIFTTLFFFIFLKSKRIIFLTSMILISSFILLSLIGENRLIKTTKLQITHSFLKKDEVNIQLKKIDEIPIGHLRHWKSSYLMAKENPLFGVGPRMFREKCKDPKYIVPGGCATHPHNLYFQILAETGMIGLLFLMLFFLYILITIFSNLKKNILSPSFIRNETMICFSAFCLFLHFFPLLPNGNFFNNWINIITFFLIGIFLHFRYKQNLND